MSLTPEDIRQFLITEENLNPSQIEFHTSLFSTGTLDSFAMVSLVSFVEKSYGVRVKPTDVTLENFDSIERILRFFDNI